MDPEPETCELCGKHRATRVASHLVTRSGASYAAEYLVWHCGYCGRHRAAEIERRLIAQERAGDERVAASRAATLDKTL